MSGSAWGEYESTRPDCTFVSFRQRSARDLAVAFAGIRPRLSAKRFKAISRCKLRPRRGVEMLSSRFGGRSFEVRVGADAPSAQPSEARLQELSPIPRLCFPTNATRVFQQSAEPSP